MWPYPWTHVGTPSHLGHMDRVAATMPSQAHAGAAQEAPDIGQWEEQDVPLVRPSYCNVKGGIPSSRRYLPTYLHGELYASRTDIEIGSGQAGSMRWRSAAAAELKSAFGSRALLDSSCKICWSVTLRYPPRVRTTPGSLPWYCHAFSGQYQSLEGSQKLIHAGL